MKSVSDIDKLAGSLSLTQVVIVSLGQMEDVLVFSALTVLR